MRAFEKILQQIKNTTPLSGHALANEKNRANLREAKKEIEKMLRECK